MNFCSDNVAGAAPEIVEAIARANHGPAMPYGNDPWTERVERRLAEIFEHEVAVFPVATGTAANVLCLAALTPPWGTIYCHAESHIAVDECGAPEFYTGGAKLALIAGQGGKIAAAELKPAGAGIVHHAQPAAVSLTQASEAGTVYTPAEIASIAELCRAHGLGLHMDGARFANALVALGCTPAEMTWKSGVDALSFGATKNGAVAAEAAVFFDKEKAASLPYRRKRGGHLFSKMRFLSAQLDAYLEGDLWLRNARHANRMATRLADGLAALPGARLAYPVEANEIFVFLPVRAIGGLEAQGFRFYRWAEEEGGALLRLVCAFDTEAAHVEAFLAAARAILEP
jgi:threonine aldolase